MKVPVKLLSVFILFSCLLLALNFGLRSSMGFFLAPISEHFNVGREVFAMSLALQNLCWGLFQPIAGAFADRFGTKKTVILGSLLYALGLYITSIADSVATLHLGSGLLVGMGIAGTGFGIVLPAIARCVEPSKRAFALGIGTAAGSAGQFLLVPAAQEFLAAYGWQSALVIMAVGALMMMMFVSVFDNGKATSSHMLNEGNQTLKEALTEAKQHRHYWLLIAGFFVCGFQLSFITVHMPAFLSDSGFDQDVAAVSLALIGLLNIFGCLLFGSWSGKYSKTMLLGIIYLLRSIAIVAFITIPMTTTTVYIFSMVTGFLWLATVPPTSGMVGQMFGLKHMGTLYGIVFLNHQIGSFFGVWLGGYLYDSYGSYEVVWWLAAAMAFVTAFIHIFIDERPVKRLRASAANPV